MIKKIFVFFTLAAIILGGCNSSKLEDISNSSPANSEPSKLITSSDGAYNRINELVYKMEKIRVQAGTNYQDLNNNNISVGDFRDKNSQLLESLSELNSYEQDTEYELTASEKEAVNFDALYKTYLKASKDLTDYLYLAEHLKDDKLKAKYQELIVDKYDNDIAELKKLIEGADN